MHLQLRKGVVFESLYQHQIDRLQAPQKCLQCGRRFNIGVKQGELRIISKDDFPRTSLAMQKTILALLVKLKPVMRVFDGGDTQTPRPETGDQGREQRCFPASRPADDPQNLHVPRSNGRFRRGDVPQAGVEIVPAGNQGKNRRDPQQCATDEAWMQPG